MANDNYTDDNINSKNTLLIIFYTHILALFIANILLATLSYGVKQIELYTHFYKVKNLAFLNIVDRSIKKWLYQF